LDTLRTFRTLRSLRARETLRSYSARVTLVTLVALRPHRTQRHLEDIEILDGGPGADGQKIAAGREWRQRNEDLRIGPAQDRRDLETGQRHLPASCTKVDPGDLELVVEQVGVDSRDVQLLRRRRLRRLRVADCRSQGHHQHEHR
jgi:hypothetical protein